MPFNVLQGIADLDGDNDLELIVAGHCAVAGQEIHAYDAASGSLEWTMAMPEACDGTNVSWPGPKALSSGDLDGDGRDEVYFTQGNVLYALAEIGGVGTWLWRATFGPGYNEFSGAVIADVDGTGRPQILVNHPDGYLFGLGNRFPDTDGDGANNDVDADDDNDGLDDEDESASGTDAYDPDSDDDGVGDAVDADPLVATPIQCTGGNGVNATVAETVAADLTCVASASIDVQALTQVLGPGGHLHLVAPSTGFRSGFTVRAGGQLSVASAEPCPGCP